MIFVTGDTHGEPKRLNTENFPEQKELCREDYVIIWRLRIGICRR